VACVQKRHTAHLLLGLRLICDIVQASVSKSLTEPREQQMEKEKIIELAKQAWKESGESWVVDGWFSSRADCFAAFAKMVIETYLKEKNEN